MCRERVEGGEGLVGTAGAGSLDVMGRTASHSLPTLKTMFVYLFLLH